MVFPHPSMLQSFMRLVYPNVLTDVGTARRFLYMNTNTATEVRFTAKRAARWCNTSHRWITISQEAARELIALGAVELKKGEWI